MFSYERSRSNQSALGLGPFVDAWDVLSMLASESACGFRSKCWKISPGRPEKGEFHIGAYLSRHGEKAKSSQLHITLTKKLNPSGSVLAWVGYESGAKFPDGFRRSVWLYCHDKKQAEAFAQSMKTKIIGVTTDVARDGDWCAVIASGSDSM